MRKAASLAVLAVLILTSLPLLAQSKTDPNDPDLQMVTRIRDEEFHRSKIMWIMSELSDRIGPRLTGSPDQQRASEWTRDTLASWGLENAHLETWGPFGRGWQEEFGSVRMIAPDFAQLYAIPKPWAPGTSGAVTGKVIKINITSKEDIEKYKGKLAGMIVLDGDAPEVKPEAQAALERYDEKKLEDIYHYQIPPERQQVLAAFLKRLEVIKLKNQLFADEKPLAVIEPSRGESGGGTIFVQGAFQSWSTEPTPVPTLVMAVEHYGRLARLVDAKVPVEVEVNVKADFYDNAQPSDTVAEIPGTDLKDQVVMLGAHLDSWAGGTGATDNGAGSAVMMEAVRLLKVLGVKPRRTVRIALWTGEEQGLLGSRAYCENHFGTRPDPTDPAVLKMPRYFWPTEGRPLTLKPEQEKVSVYFNVDNGTGKIRGIYTQENAAVVPIFEHWMKPFADLGMTTISMRNTGGTDHLSFDAVGIPGFQFIQDPIEYDTRTHHSNMDVYERIQREDMMQMAAIVADFVYNAAMRDDMFPRKPLPPDTRKAEPEKKSEKGKGKSKKQ